MRLSTGFLSTSRTKPREAEAPGHALLLRAGYIESIASGIFALLPLGFRSIRNIEQILREEMAAIGGQELSMPIVQPADPWVKTGRYESIGPELMRFSDRFGRPMVLALTHEEIVASIAHRILKSYKQLPMLVYQIQTKFRDEARPRMGLVRMREFAMKDSYSFDVDQQGLQKQYDAHYEAYFRIFKRVGLPDVVSVESDTGVMGGNLAHEFMYLSRHGEDTLMLCEKCGQAWNISVAEGRESCDSCGASVTCCRGIEVGNIFQLGDRYTKAFDVAVLDARGHRITPIMGSYGIGVGRLLACLAEEYHDERGLKLPQAIAPFQVTLVALSSYGDEIRSLSEMLYDRLMSAGIDVLYDDRDISTGVKLADADLIGVPLRLTVGERSLRHGGVEVSMRTTQERAIVNVSELSSRIFQMIR